MEIAGSDSKNNFGFIRLCLASAVIIGHSPELIDGNSDREFVSQITGGISLGGLSVVGFFLLSGYLISKSMVRTANITNYGMKRALRIVPAFVVAYLISVFVIAPALGASPVGHLGSVLVHVVTLHEPPAFFGAVEPHYQTINGAMWTIAYEVRCYILIAVLWWLGVLTNSTRLFALAAASAFLTIVLQLPIVFAYVEPLAKWPLFDLVIGRPSRLAGFVTVFLLGACTFQARHKILPRLTGRMALVAALLMLPAARLPIVGTIVFDVLGAVALFWLVFHAELGSFARINRNWDISYGVYLYGWPSAMIMLQLIPGITPAQLALSTLTMAVALGTASWLLVERHFKLDGNKIAGVRLRWLSRADEAAT